MTGAVYVSWNPATNAYVCLVSDPDGDWTAVRVDDVWYRESALDEVRGGEIIAQLEEAVADFCADGAN